VETTPARDCDPFEAERLAERANAAAYDLAVEQDADDAREADRRALASDLANARAESDALEARLRPFRGSKPGRTDALGRVLCDLPRTTPPSPRRASGGNSRPSLRTETISRSSTSRATR